MATDLIKFYIRKPLLIPTNSLDINAFEYDFNIPSNSSIKITQIQIYPVDNNFGITTYESKRFKFFIEINNQTTLIGNWIDSTNDTDTIISNQNLTISSGANNIKFGICVDGSIYQEVGITKLTRVDFYTEMNINAKPTVSVGQKINHIDWHILYSYNGSLWGDSIAIVNGYYGLTNGEQIDTGDGVFLASQDEFFPDPGQRITASWYNDMT